MPRTFIQPRLQDLSRYVNRAQQEGFRFELIEPAYPENLDSLGDYFTELANSDAGNLVDALHGPYIDIAVHSADRAVRKASADRIAASLAWAQRLGARTLILHSNHLPMINEDGYDRAWLAGWLDFLGGLDFGDVTVVIENMWDRTPELMVRLVEAFDSPHLRLCLDVAHWNVYGTVSLDAWMSVAGRHTAYVQLGDNHGDHDADLALGSGTVDWFEVDRCLRRYAPEADVMVGVGIDHGGTRLDTSLGFLRSHGVHPFTPVAGGGRG